MAKLRRIYVWLGIGILLLGFALSALAVRHVRLGLTIVYLKAAGSLPDIGWVALYRMGRPGNRRHYNLRALAKSPNPFAVIQNPYTDAPDVSAGASIFRLHCATCHGSGGSGGLGGPSLRKRQMTHGSSDWALFRTITHGIRGTPMPPSDLPWADRWRLVAYVKSLMLPGENTINAVTDSGISTLAPVRYKSLLSADRHTDEWLTYSGAYDGQRFSPIKQITPANVAGLRLLWMRQYRPAVQPFETSPLVIGNYMFLTVPPDQVDALDARTGRLIWAYRRKLPDHIPECCTSVNRGLAVLGNTLFLGTLDAHLVALDIATGHVQWDVQIANYRQGYSITSAPLTLKNLVITGVAGGEFGIRGFVDARNAETGKEVWKFYTVPAPGEPGADTWEGNSWKTGGAPTWVTGSFDPQANLIYWPTGNPSPDYDGEVRKGDDLYSNSVLALDADRGTLRWYFQVTPHGYWDWDATEPLVLFNKDVAGVQHHYLAQADRNGFYYLLDRETGKFLLATPFVKQTWADKIDSKGHPVVNPAAIPSEQGTVVYPGVYATNWMSSSYSPLTGFIYVTALKSHGLFLMSPFEYHPGQRFDGGLEEGLPGNRPHVAVLALNALTGQQEWEYRNLGYVGGGLLSTGGGIVFGSQMGTFFALDARTGRELWHVETNGGIIAAPITYMCDGKQMVTIAAGHAILTFGL